ncbi:pentapeptide repeat-containing protein [Streptomyces sp. MB09-01]|uniref:pentapeptide repeat-containing protein n=1 Tax=Streptomyces sp. MB09-01 TaxID=3028666 RepID=UPI0029A070D8|nr:pentapeptide repeat-containing protein [Streptomyces sp. MB09-01]MDX3539648.1 pentapeptide repeat-containing protein [Streptomyces sp. MB09-01]
MTTLTGAVDSVRLLFAESPNFEAQNQVEASVAPWWALPAATLIGGVIAWSAAWFSARQLRRSAQEEIRHEQARLLNERFVAAAELLGHDEPACRLAGIHAMAGLADDWAERERRQTCIDVLCAYLRMPYPPEPAESARIEERCAWQAAREVRHTVIRTIRDRLHPRISGSVASWEGYDFDFTGVVFDGGSFRKARFTGGYVSFRGAEFTGDLVNFRGSVFAGGNVSFDRATFAANRVGFRDAEFIGGYVSFDYATFIRGYVTFRDADFTGGTVSFRNAKFSGGKVNLQKPKAWTVPPIFDDAVLADPPAALLLPKPAES